MEANKSAEGSIIIVNMTTLGSDAIIVTTSATKVVPILDLSARQSMDWIIQDLSTLSSDGGRKNKAYLTFLSWLWYGCVKPIFEELQYVVSGFQVARFRHVVGCLWASEDQVCVAIAKSFYSERRRAAWTSNTKV